MKTSNANVLAFPAKKPVSVRNAKPEIDSELLDINAYITKGKAGFVAYPVTGDSTVSQIQPGFLVFVDPKKKPAPTDVTLLTINGRNCVRQCAKEGFVVVGHLSVYARQGGAL